VISIAASPELVSHAAESMASIVVASSHSKTKIVSDPSPPAASTTGDAAGEAPGDAMEDDPGVASSPSAAFPITTLNGTISNIANAMTNFHETNGQDNTERSIHGCTRPSP